MLFCFIDIALWLRSGSEHSSTQSTVTGASCSNAAMGAREDFYSVSRFVCAH
jgi:hypothetical protein